MKIKKLYVLPEKRNCGMIDLHSWKHGKGVVWLCSMGCEKMIGKAEESLCQQSIYGK